MTGTDLVALLLFLAFVVVTYAVHALAYMAGYQRGYQARDEDAAAARSHSSTSTIVTGVKVTRSPGVAEWVP